MQDSRGLVREVGDFLRGKKMADGVGFEPTETRASAVFKTATINHSDTHPDLTA